MNAVYALIGLLIAAPVSAFSQAETAKIDQLLNLIQQRLDFAPIVAENKWNTKIPIEDWSREQHTMNLVEQQAKRYKLDSGLVKEFFAAQIEANKIIQTVRHKAWAKENRPPFEKTIDPSQEIYPMFDRLEPQLLKALQDALPIIKTKGGKRLLDARAADFIKLGGNDLQAGTIALKPLYDLAR